MVPQDLIVATSLYICFLGVGKLSHKVVLLDLDQILTGRVSLHCIYSISDRIGEFI